MTIFEFQTEVEKIIKGKTIKTWVKISKDINDKTFDLYITFFLKKNDSNETICYYDIIELPTIKSVKQKIEEIEF